MVDREKFYNSVRHSLFSDKIMQLQLQGMNVIIDKWEAGNYTDVRWLAYIFATIYHECAKTMQPIKEFGGAAYYVKKYWTNQAKAKDLGNKSSQDAINCCGKGFCMITGRKNYEKMGKVLGVDLIGNTDLALNPIIAADIIFEGMTEGRSYAGDFTNRCLSQYFNKKNNDPVGARAIINGKDDADLIAGYYKQFLFALT